MVTGVRVGVAPEFGAGLLAFAVAGVALGTASGLTPGLHANNFALLLAAIAPTIPGSTVQVGAAVLAAGVVHTFLDVVPALAFGVPDPAMAASALPGHTLVLEGRGREALRLSAAGSGAAVALAVPLALPLTAAMTVLYPSIRAHLPVVLAATVAFLVLTEPTWRSRVGGAASFLASAALGAVALDVPVEGFLDAGGMLAPLFAGLFGAPVLLDALDGAGVPPQDDAAVTLARRDFGLTAAAGSFAGAVVGYVPGVSAAIAAVLSLPAVPGRSGARGFLVATSGANTANTVFALFALVALGTPRTGVMVALDDLDVASSATLPALLAVAVAAAAVGFVLVVVLGERYLAAVGRLDYTAVCLGVLALLVVVAVLFAGPVGVLALVAATGVGLLPVRLGARRVHLMGVLIGPLALGV